MNKKIIERRALMVSIIMNCIIGLSGIVVYIITGLNFLLLDSVFSLIAFISSIAAYFISKNSHRKTENFPNGMYFLEPLYGLLKSIATLMLLIITLLETSAVAFAYFVNGEGDPMISGPVLPYTLIMIFLCFGLYIYNHSMNKRINNISTMIAAEARGNFVDGLISLCVAAAMILLSFIDINGPLGFFHYTGDFFITAILVIFSFKEPWNILVHSFREFARSTVQNSAIKEEVLAIFHKLLPDYDNKLDILIFKQGMAIKIEAHIISIDNIEVVDKLAEMKTIILRELRRKFDHIQLEFIF